jgi:hypothetical protein
MSRPAANAEAAWRMAGTYPRYEGGAGVDVAVCMHHGVLTVWRRTSRSSGPLARIRLPRPLTVSVRRLAKIGAPWTPLRTEETKL